MHASPKTPLTTNCLRVLQVSAQYAAVMIPDDDLVMDVDTINTAFSVFQQYGLALAQPSLCRYPHPRSPVGICNLQQNNYKLQQSKCALA